MHTNHPVAWARVRDRVERDTVIRIVEGWHDDDAVGHPDDAPGLTEDDLDLARVAVPAGREVHGLRARGDRGEVDERPLRLADDLLIGEIIVVRRAAKILGRDLDKRNFRKRIQKLGILKSLKKKRTGGRFRPAELYRFTSDSVKDIEVL